MSGKEENLSLLKDLVQHNHELLSTMQEKYLTSMEVLKTSESRILDLLARYEAKLNDQKVADALRLKKEQAEAEAFRISATSEPERSDSDLESFSIETDSVISAGEKHLLETSTLNVSLVQKLYHLKHDLHKRMNELETKEREMTEAITKLSAREDQLTRVHYTNGFLKMALASALEKAHSSNENNIKIYERYEEMIYLKDKVLEELETTIDHKDYKLENQEKLISELAEEKRQLDAHLEEIKPTIDRLERECSETSCALKKSEERNQLLKVLFTQLVRFITQFADNSAKIRSQHILLREARLMERKGLQKFMEPSGKALDTLSGQIKIQKARIEELQRDLESAQVAHKESQSINSEMKEKIMALTKTRSASDVLLKDLVNTIRVCRQKAETDLARQKKLADQLFFMLYKVEDKAISA